MNTTKIKSFIFTAMLIATAITISCSGDGDGGGGDGGGNDLSSSGVETSSSGAVSGSVDCSGYDPDAPSNKGKFTDPRDSQEYSTILICNQTWLAENLNFDAPGSVCYDDDPDNCDTYGRLYNWNTAMNNAASSNAIPSGVQGVCPPDWHLPSDAEWTVLTNYVESNSGCTGCAGRHLKSASGWSSGGNGQDTYGFSALPGDRGLADGSFLNNIGNHGNWWSATENDAISALYRRMSYNGEYMNKYPYNKSDLYSVRCLQD